MEHLELNNRRMVSALSTEATPDADKEILSSDCLHDFLGIISFKRIVFKYIELHSIG